MLTKQAKRELLLLKRQIVESMPSCSHDEVLKLRDRLKRIDLALKELDDMDAKLER